MAREYIKTPDGLIPVGDTQGYYQENYSTEESVCGTWIDGKPIYKRTFKDTATAAGYTNIGTIENFDKLIKVDGNYLSTTIGWIGYYSNHGIAGTNISRLYVVDTNGVVKIYVGTSGYSTAAADSAYVTIYYTKTTD